MNFGLIYQREIDESGSLSDLVSGAQDKENSGVIVHGTFISKLQASIKMQC